MRQLEKLPSRNYYGIENLTVICKVIRCRIFPIPRYRPEVWGKGCQWESGKHWRSESYFLRASRRRVEKLHLKIMMVLDCARTKISLGSLYFWGMGKCLKVQSGRQFNMPDFKNSTI